MPSIERNIETWTTYRWQFQGDEWSSMWGGSDYEWWGAIFPRIQEFLPASTVLEIAPGHGRWTRYLVHLSESLIGVDLAPNCVEACRERFAGYENATFHLTDGASLHAVPDGSINFAFSFDSLVHADAEVLEGYVHELSRKLTPDGIAFIHHSNLLHYRDPDTDVVPGRNVGWRGRMSAELFERFCSEAGLSCIGQELVNWATDRLNDCFSLVTRPGGPCERPNRVRENPRFMEEAAALREMALFYGSRTFPGLDSKEPGGRLPLIFGDRDGS